MASLRFKSITKSFGSFAAVRELSLEVKNGEFLVLLGPSGCGKTTLLRMTAGLEEADSGEICMDGARINELPPKDRDIAMVFQSYALYPHMTVAENMGYPLKVRKIERGEIDRRVQAVAQLLGLSSLLSRRPRELSGGQRQRVALGRAIVRKPGVFLMDEPLSNLDAQLRMQMRAEIKRLQRDLGVTTMYVTHDQVEAMSMASRIAIFKDGSLRQVGAPEEIFTRPADRFVAGFVGTPPMNFLEAELVPEGIALGESGSLHLLRRRHGLKCGRVTIGVRPHHVALSRSGGVAATTYVTEPLGDDYHVVVETNGSRVTVRCGCDPGFAPGAPARLLLDESKLHLFDAESGIRLDPNSERIEANVLVP